MWTQWFVFGLGQVAASCDQFRVLRIGRGRADNLLTSQGLCYFASFDIQFLWISCFSWLFMNISVLKHRRPLYEMISSNLPTPSSIVFLSLYYQHISRRYSTFTVPLAVSLLSDVHKYISGPSSQNFPLTNQLSRHKSKYSQTTMQLHSFSLQYVTVH